MQTFQPSIDADPEYEDFSDEQTVEPVPTIYLPKLVPVHMVPSQRVILKNIYLKDITSASITKICDASEIGIGARITLQLHGASTAAVAIASDREHLENAFQYNAAYGALPPQAYVIPFLATCLLPPLVIATCAELWACPVGAAGHATLSVMVEQFYGDN